MWQERGKHSEKLEKWKLDDIHKFMDLLDMPRGSGDKKVGPLSVHAAGRYLPLCKICGSLQGVLCALQHAEVSACSMSFAVITGASMMSEGTCSVVQTKVSSVMDFLEKPEKLSDTDKAEKVTRWHCDVSTDIQPLQTLEAPCRLVSVPTCPPTELSSTAMTRTTSPR